MGNKFLIFHSFFLLSLVTAFAIDLTMVPEAAPPHHHHHHHHHGHPPSPSPSPVHHHYSHPPSHSPVHSPSRHHHQGHPPFHAPAYPPSHHDHHHHHGHPPVHAPAYPPSHHDHHHHGHSPSPSPVYPPVDSPIYPPVDSPIYPPVDSPVYPPVDVHPPRYHFPRSFVAVQGVLYCKSCKYAGVDTLIGAKPLFNATVKLECNNTKATLVKKATSDKNGYFFIEAPKPLTTFGAHKCKISLVSSPLASCSKPSDFHGGLKGSILRPEKSYQSKHMPFVLYSVGPFAFEPKCSH